MLVWYGIVAVRTLFLIVLTITTGRAASAGIEHFPSVYETPGDLIRLLSGLRVCSWFIANLIILPKDAGTGRGCISALAVPPLSALCAVVVW